MPASYTQLQAVFDQASRWMVILALDGTIVEVNQAFLQVSGLGRDTLLGKPLIDCPLWQEVPQQQAELRSALAHLPMPPSAPVHGQFPNVDHMHSPGSMGFSMGLLHNAMGEIQGILVTEADRGKSTAIELQLQAQVELDRELANLFRTFIQSPAEQLPRIIQQALQSLGELLQLDTCYVFEYTADVAFARMAYEWVRAGISPQKEQLQNLSSSFFPWSKEKIRGGETVCIPNIVDLPPEAAIDQKNWLQFGVRSLLLIPIISAEGQVLGSVGFAALRQPQSWTEQNIQALHFFAETVLNAMQRQQTASALQESEARLRLALSAANQGLYDAEIQTGKVIVNENYARMLGYDPQTFEESASQWAERLHPEERDSIVATYQAYVRGEIPEYAVEFRIRTANGDWKWMFSVGKIMAWDEKGMPQRMLGTHTDITALKQAEALKSELRILEDILESTLAGYWDWDISSQTVYLSPTWKRMLGYGIDELTEFDSWQHPIFPEDLSKVLENFEQHFQSRGQIPYCKEIRFRHKNGNTVWVICSGRVIDWDEQGNPLRMIGCHVDITRQKETEKQLQQLNQELRRSNQELEQFAYVTSHDLQEPLRAITAYTQLLLSEYGEKLSDPKAQKYTAFLLDGSQRMRMLIQDLLAYSRVGSLELKWVEVDCNELLAEILGNLQEAIASSQTQIYFEGLPTVRGDRTQFLQLFQNLLSNGIKFNLSGSPQIHIQAAQQTNLTHPNQVYWLFSVQDNGIGIKERYFERIFEIFRRLHTREQFPGTGIGLAICKRVVERHGGEIWAESDLGKGTTIYFTLLLES